MKDNVLHSDPTLYHTYNNCTAEEEIAAGTTEALYRKLKFIDRHYAELETLMGRKQKDWVSLKHLVSWYALIECELQFRQATHIVSTKAYITPMVYLNQHVCTKRS